MLSHILPALIGAAITALLGGAAYLIKRRIEGTATITLLEKRAKVLALKTNMEHHGLTSADLDAFEAELTKRREKTDTENEVAAELALKRASSLEGPRPGETQAEMNLLAGADLEIARAMMAKAMHELVLSALGNGDLFETSQKAWKRYAEAEARARSAFCLGGTMHPCTYAAGLEQLTVSRIADIREQTKFLRSL